jgi:hypothetical protein
VAFCYNSKVTAQSVGPQYLLPGATVHNQGPKVQPLGQSSPPGAKFRFKGRTRVTRLGEFSPICAVFSKITAVVHNSELLFPWLRLCISFNRNCVGLHFGRFFFQNSSGHPGPNSCYKKLASARRICFSSGQEEAAANGKPLQTIACIQVGPGVDVMTTTFANFSIVVFSWKPIVWFIFGIK